MNPIPQSAYPITWPIGTKRRNSRQTSAFASRSIEQATREILNQLRITGVRDYNVIISTNLILRNDGLPRSGQPQPADPAAAVYFRYKEKPHVMACDRWNRVEDNLWAIAKHLEAMRAQERWGVGTIEQAFAGYTALPAPGESSAETWYNVLKCREDCTYDHARQQYIQWASCSHPDTGGSHEAMVRLNAAWDQARRHFQR